MWGVAELGESSCVSEVDGEDEMSLTLLGEPVQYQHLDAREERIISRGSRYANIFILISAEMSNQEVSLLHDRILTSFGPIVAHPAGTLTLTLISIGSYRADYRLTPDFALWILM